MFAISFTRTANNLELSTYPIEVYHKSILTSALRKFVLLLKTGVIQRILRK